MEVEVIKKSENYRSGGVPDGVTKKLKVAAYARVSTDLEEQQTSFVSQQKYYLDKISDNKDWIFVEVYADEGISGTQAFKRENFMRMIKDAEEGKIDLILTKSISRFARNTLDTLKYVRLLKANGIAIIFEEENINTLDMAGELLLTVLSSVAQQESETISSHIRLGIKMKRERGELVGFTSCYGYVYDSKANTMSINKKEAENVKLIFETYLKGYGTTYISDMLGELGILSPNGKSRWQATSIMHILKNEVYIGDVVQGKTYTVDSITHQRKPNHGEEDKYYIKDHHEPIIERDVFERVQEIIKNRANIIKKGSNPSCKNPFTGKMRCGYCGRSYGRRGSKNSEINTHWNCLTAVKGSRNLCPESKAIPESVIKQAFMEVFYLLSNKNGLALDEFLDTIKQSLNDDTPKMMLQKKLDERKQLKTRLSKLVDLYVDGQIEKEVFERKQKRLEENLEDINKKISSLEKHQNASNTYETNINRIKNEMKSRETINKIQEFDVGLFESLVDYVIIGGYDENNVSNEFMLRFIIRNGFYFKSRNDITDEKIINNGINNNNNSIYTPILDYISTQQFVVYENGENKRVKKIINKVRVRVEIEKL